MIIEAIINFFFGIVDVLLSMAVFPSFDIDISVLDPIFSVFSIVGYLLPLTTVYNLLSIVVAINVFRIFIAILKMVWSILPFT